MQQGRVGPIDPQQFALPNAVVQGARVEIRERLLGHDGTAESLLAVIDFENRGRERVMWRTAGEKKEKIYHGICLLGDTVMSQSAD